MRNYHLFLLFCVIVAAAASASSFKDEKRYDRAMARQIANWLVQAARNRDASVYSAATKRNSEIINSILGLPKNLNDVGKK